MTDDCTAPSPDEEVLAGVFRELEACDGPPPDEEELLRRHPHLADEIRELLAMQRTLSGPQTIPALVLPRTLGEFRVVRRLETGGMSNVYEAWQESLHRRVALKVMRRGHHSPQARERFMREQLVLARLHQTHIVPIHAAGREGPIEYFAMPFIEGAALRYIVDAAEDLGSRRPAAQTPAIADLVVRARTGARSESAACGSLSGREDRPAGAQRRGAPPFRPSMDYLRSAARVMADAALAVQHAHEQGVLHRDIKPSNIMVEAFEHADGRRTDQCWVIDFGLASYAGASGVTNAEGAGALRQPDAGAPAGPHAVSGVMGTPAYMAPEQFEGRADERTDVWGLGVTLYELLTLRRAFPVSGSGGSAEGFAAMRAQILTVEPPRPRGRVPRDLEAICTRAIRKDPRERYATAREFANDLQRWLDDEPVVARSDAVPLLAAPIRCVKWARRNRGWSAAIGVVFAASVSIAAITYQATDRARMILELDKLGSPPRQAGWSGKARVLAQRIRAGGDDADLQDAFTATLAGIDAHRLDVHTTRASAVSFDESSGEVLLGGAAAEPEFEAVPAMSWRPGSDAEHIGLAAAGPLTCRPDGTRLQFVHAVDLRFRLWDMTRQREERSFSLAPGDSAVSVPVRNELHQPVLAMAANGSIVAAAAARGREDGQESSVGVVAVWEAATARLLLRIPIRATALAVSGDGSLLAVGDGEGGVTVWSLPEGRRLPGEPGDHEGVQALAFGRHPFGSASGDAQSAELQLAIGCDSGRITVWDLGRRSVRSICRGMGERVLSLAFSPDGSLLAAAGSVAMLWDCATGERLLDIGGTYCNAAAFSGDGKRLAVADYERFGHRGQVHVWELQDGRGIKTLRGLSARARIIAFSADSGLVAALSDDRRIAIWDCGTAGIRRIVDAPRSFSGDNAGLAFSRDGSKLACLTGTEARLWEVMTGKLLQRWQLPAGLIDSLVFDVHGNLLAARCEQAETADSSPERTHAVVHVRRLEPDGGITPLLEVADCDVKLIDLKLDPEGAWLALEGQISGAPGVRQCVRAFEIPSGRRLWSVDCRELKDYASLHVDPAGRYLSYRNRLDDSRTLVSMPSGRVVGTSDAFVGLGPAAEITIADTESGGIALSRRGAAQPLLRWRPLAAAWARIDRSGTRIAWGNSDGTVLLGDLDQLLGSLAELDPAR